MWDSLWPHGLQHTRLPCPSPTPGACSNSCPSRQWYHPTISSSVDRSPVAFNLSKHQGLFQWVSSSNQVVNALELQFHHPSFQWVFRVDFLEDELVWSPCSPRDSQESSPTPQFKSLSSSTLSFLTLCDPMDYTRNSPGQNPGVGSLSLLQGIFPTQGLNPGLPHGRQILYQLSHQRNPGILKWVAYPFPSRSSWPRNWTGVSCIVGRFFTNELSGSPSLS